jgi:hypothetical protein
VTDWAEERPTIELVKATVTVPEVAQLLGYDVDAGDKIPSPWNPEERTPSCHLYDDHFYDYSTGKGGDCIDLLMLHDPEATIDSALWQLWRRALRAGLEPGHVETQKPRELENFVGRIQQYEFVEAVYDLPTHGVFRDPFTSDLFVAHWVGQQPPEGGPDEFVYGVKVRYRDGAKGAWPGSQFMHKLYSPVGWNPEHMVAGAHTAVICEGESDSWAMRQQVGELADVFALPSGAGSWKDHWLEDLEQYSTIYLCFDNDRAGQQALEKVTRKIGHERAHELRVPQLYNDAREAIGAGWRPMG